MPVSLERPMLRAPRDDGAVVLAPQRDAIGEALRSNVDLLATSGIEILDQPLAKLSAAARCALIGEATTYTRAYRDVSTPTCSRDTPILLAGHQPQLFHPGVWLKNFALGALARQQGAFAINLVIDNDVALRSTVAVPTGSPQHPSVDAVALDAPGGGIPYEQRRIVDRSVFDSFGPRAARTIAPLVGDPLVRELWPRAIERAAATGNLGLSIAQSRHQLEGAWGLSTLEVPLSHVCRGEPFVRFAAHLLAEADQFREIHNTALAEYRQLHRLRSRSHPVPDLAAEDDWREVPLWVWTEGDPRRRHVFVSRAGEELILSDRESLEFRVADPFRRPEQAVEQLLVAAARGVRIRPRALVTTMFSRLVLGDLFMHGIGGAKYDELTDAILARWLEVPPPRFIVLSGTRLLPVERPEVAPDDLRQIDRRLRELEYQPERFLDGPPADEASAAAIASKRRWIATDPTPENAAARYRAIRQANAALQPVVEPLRRELRQQRVRIAEDLRARGVLASRDWAFCLFPADALRDWVLETFPTSA